MKKPKRRSGNFRDNLTSIRWKLTSCFKELRTKEEKLSLTSREWVEKFEALRMKKKSSNPEFKVRLKEAKTMKPC